MLFKLALRNVKRQIGNYLIYFITVTIVVALIFAVNNMIFSDVVENIKMGVYDGTQAILVAVSCFISLIVAFVLGYATSFLVRRRKKEFGLYLTLGMSRKNVIAVFSVEIVITFVLSLGFGVLLGMLVYQALMAIFINFLGIEYVLSGYSAIGFALTIGIVVIMFLIASLASVVYLRHTKISRLLQGDVAEKHVLNPFAWLFAVAVGIALIAVAAVGLYGWVQTYDLNTFALLMLSLCAGVFLVPFGAAKCAVPLCIKHGAGQSGTGKFTLRQLSGRLNANSVMSGIISVLLTLAIATPNVFLNMYVPMGEEVRDYFYDISISYGYTNYSGDYYDENFDGHENFYDFRKELAIVEKHAKISETISVCEYRLVSAQSEGTNRQFSLNDSFIGVSDYNKLCRKTGLRPLELTNSYHVLYDKGDEEAYSGSYENVQLQLGGTIYYGDEAEAAPKKGIGKERLVVVPDSALSAEQLKPEYQVLYVMLPDRNYNAVVVWDELYNLYYNARGGVRCPEADRIRNVSGIGFFLIGSLFMTVVFMLLSMAMLALKMLCMLTEDRERYKMLWRVGASKSMIYRSLFSQMFFFYFMPFILPLGLSLVLAYFLHYLNLGAIPLLTLMGQVYAIAGIMLVLYALYFTITYLIARRDVQKTLQAVG